MKKKLTCLAIVPMMLALASCFNSSSSNEITITIWEDESNIEMVKTLTDEYLTKYKSNYPDSPTIKIVFEEQTEKSAIEKMSTVAAAGEGPDIAAITHDTIAAGVADKLLAPVSYDQALYYRMTPEAMNAVTYNGTVYGYPITAESMTILYDKTKITAQELSSFDALLASGKKIAWQMTGDDGGYYTSGLYTDSVIFGADGKDSTKVNLATTKAVNNVYSFFHDYGSCFIDASPEAAVSYVTNGMGGAVGLMSSPFILSSTKNALGNNLGIAKLPTINNESLRPFSGYKAYAVSRYSKNGVIAQDICNFLTSYDAMNWRLVKAGYLPACPLDATSDIKESIAESAEAQVFASSLADSFTMPNIPKMQDYWRPMNNATTKFWNEKDSLTKEQVKSALEEASQTLLS